MVTTTSWTAGHHARSTARTAASPGPTRAASGHSASTAGRCRRPCGRRRRRAEHRAGVVDGVGHDDIVPDPAPATSVGSSVRLAEAGRVGRAVDQTAVTAADAPQHRLAVGRQLDEGVVPESETTGCRRAGAIALPGRRSVAGGGGRTCTPVAAVQRSLRVVLAHQVVEQHLQGVPCPSRTAAPRRTPPGRRRPASARRTPARW